MIFAEEDQMPEETKLESSTDVSTSLSDATLKETVPGIDKLIDDFTVATKNVSSKI